MIEVNECTTISLVAEDGSEVTITMVKDSRGEFVVSLYIDDGLNVSHMHIPRRLFDMFISEMRTLQ